MKKIVRAVVPVCFLVYLFYKSVLFTVVLSIPISALYYWYLEKQEKQEEKWKLNLEFKEGLQGIAAALSAGYSMENSLEEAKKDLLVLYGEQSLLAPELAAMETKLKWNLPMEQVWEEFGEKSGVEDIKNFAQIYATARRTGGDFIRLTRVASDRIGEKIEVNREIHSLIAGKQLEGTIMTVIPLGMIGYFWVCSPGFLDPLYCTVAGRLVMSLLLGVYVAAFLLQHKICNIKV